MQDQLSSATSSKPPLSSPVYGWIVPPVVAVLAFVFWDHALLYPLKILVVLFHELSHGLAAVVTGGGIDRIEISFEQGGVCTTRGGSRFIILNAGYLGSLFWGCALLVAGARTRHDRLWVGLLGTILFAVTLLYVRSVFGFVYGLAAGAALIGIAWLLPNVVSDILLAVLGMVSCLYAIWDIGSDILFRSVPGSDAHQLAELTGIPSVVWGVLWIVLAVAATIAALRISSRRTRDDTSPT
jgi:hypothetical protein